MANKVFANGREISCKAGQGKSICAFPDVCLSPPSPPAGPVPIPYPNTGLASDTTGGSKKVKISGKEVMLKDKSSFKKSTGDEAATKSLGMGVVTHQIQGKVYFNSWSMDVKIEGENAVRHLDLTTHNHMSKPGNTPPWPFLDGMSASQAAPCKDDREKEEKACGPCQKTKKNWRGKTVPDAKATKKAECDSKDCQKARKCMLTPYKPNRCCPGQTGHHLVEVHGFCQKGKRGKPLDKFPDYDLDAAPVVCAACEKGSRYDKEHGQLHAYQGTAELDAMAAAADPEFAWTYADARRAGIEAHQFTFPESGCSPACLEAQLDSYHKKQAGTQENSRLRTENPPLQDWQKKAGRTAVDKARAAAKGKAATGARM